MALIAVLLAMVFVSVLAAGLVMLASEEASLAATHRDATVAEAAAAAALNLASKELRRLDDWDLALGGGVRSDFIDTTTTPSIGGRRVDLALATAAVQAESDLRAPWGPDSPVWHLYAFGPASALAPGDIPDTDLYLLAWVADDGGDGDGDPAADSNAVVQVLAEARGANGLRRSVVGVFGRLEPAPAPLRQLGWRYGL